MLLLHAVGLLGSNVWSVLMQASLSFPSYPTLSLSLPLSLVGLSSLFLSVFSTLKAFQSPIEPGSSQTDLDAVKFLTFLGILCPVIDLFGSIFMRVIPPPISLLLKEPKVHMLGEEPTSDDESDEEINEEAERYLAMSQSLNLDERTPLLIGGIEAALEEVDDMEKGKDINWTVGRLIRDWEGFWVFGLTLAMAIGPVGRSSLHRSNRIVANLKSETIIASIGSILTSLLPAPTSLTALAKTDPIDGTNALVLRNKHVMILSLTSTFARLVTGILADYLCPPLVAVPLSRRNSTNGPSDIDQEGRPRMKFVRKRPIILYRSMLATICTAILAGVYAWSAGYLESEKGLWVLSGGVGTLYGALFTVTVSLLPLVFWFCAE